MKNQIVRWHPFENISELADAAASRIMFLAVEAVKTKGNFSLVLAGGNTPLHVYERLSRMNPDWKSWNIYIGDERCLPENDPERNSKMAMDSFLSRVSIPAENIHFIPAEMGAEKGAEAYSRTLENMGEFDLVLLGFGEDGHTASLFPGMDQAEGDVIPVNDSPKPPPDRISLSASRLSRAKEVIFLLAGKGKKEAVKKWLSGEDIPASTISPECGVDVYIESGLLDHSAL